MVASSEIETKLGELRNKLHDYELKAKQIPHLKAEIAELEGELESTLFHVPKGSPKGSPKRDLPAAPMPPMEHDPVALDGEEAKKRMRAINKKLDQIKKLKEKEGEDLDADAIAKINSEKELLKEMECLKNGEGYKPANDVAVAFKTLPSDPAETEKKIKAIKKKLQQIDQLKAKGVKNLDAEAKAKVESGRLLEQELSALESGATTVAFAEPSLDETLEKQLAEKTELEKRLKALKKKMTQIDTLKKKNADEHDADAKAKLASEKELGKEISTVEKAISEINKAERARVEARLG